MESRRVIDRIRAIVFACCSVLGTPVILAQLVFEAPPTGEFKQQISWDYILDPQPDSDPEEFVAHNPVPNDSATSTVCGRAATAPMRGTGPRPGTRRGRRAASGS